MFSQDFYNLNHQLLPHYDNQRIQERLTKMSQRIQNIEQRIRPRKKFSFRNPQSAKSDQPSQEIPQKTIEQPQISQSSFLENCSFQILFPETEWCESYTIQHCRQSTFVIASQLTAIHLRHLTDCTIVCAPVTSSVMIEKCENCTLVVGGHQIRIHNSYNCEVYLLAKGQPILEGCKDLCVSPYSFQYSQVNDHLQRMGMSESEVNKWDEITDLEWFQSGKSPHWKRVQVGPKSFSLKSNHFYVIQSDIELEITLEKIKFDDFASLLVLKKS
jgi:tubulin-specific chaperone C